MRIGGQQAQTGTREVAGATVSSVLSSRVESVELVARPGKMKRVVLVGE